MALPDKSLSKAFENMEVIGKGGCGTVYKGIDKISGKELALKVEHYAQKPQLLDSEMSTYRLLWKSPNAQNYIPCVYEFFDDEDRGYVMTMDLLDKNLGEVFKLCNKKFSLRTILILADQMFGILEFIHSNGVVHKDIKPENFVFGKKEKKNSLFLIDFGMAGTFLDEAGNHIPFLEVNSFRGSLMYASINTHFCVEKTRRDDLFSLAYVFLKLLGGDLPWEGKEYDDVSFLKRTTNIGNILFKDYPEEFAIYFDYCYEMWYRGVPDYEYMKGLFRNLFKKMGFEYDPKSPFEWDSL